MGGLALAMLVVYAYGRSRPSPLPPLLMRILAAAGIVVPGMTIVDWLRQLQRAREWARDLPIRGEPIAELLLVRSAALLSAGFLILVGGVYLARRLPQAGRTGAPRGNRSVR